MFVGREKELQKLKRHLDRKTFQLAVIYGRRRVGKTALITEFARTRRTLFFTALEQGDTDNLRDFSGAASAFFGLPLAFESWRAGLDFLAERAKREPFVLVFDEFPYAAKAHPALPSELQVCIDRKLKDTGLSVILCGSNQGFMESDVLGEKSPLYGRRTLQMKLGPLGFSEAAEMLPGMEPAAAFEHYACFGGVPYYLAQLDSAAPLRQNLADLYFDESGFCYGEPLMLLRQELSEPATYHSILRAIAAGANRQSRIADRVGMPATSLPRYLSTLVDLGIVEKAAPFGEDPSRSKRGIYRVREALFDFWFSFVMPHVAEVESGAGALVADNITDQMLDAYLGRRFERVCAEWLLREALARRLPLNATSIGSWWGTNALTREQTDIDVLAADRATKTLLIGECKYRESFDESGALASLEAKRDLVKGYRATALALFSKHPLSGETHRKVAKRADILTVALNDLYARPEPCGA